MFATLGERSISVAAKGLKATMGSDPDRVGVGDVNRNGKMGYTSVAAKTVRKRLREKGIGIGRRAEECLIV